MDRFNGRDLVAIILALGVAGAVLAATVGTVIEKAFTITATEGQLLGTIIGAAIGAVATYLGGRGSDGGPDERPEP